MYKTIVRRKANSSKFTFPYFTYFFRWVSIHIFCHFHYQSIHCAEESTSRNLKLLQEAVGGSSLSVAKDNGPNSTKTTLHIRPVKSRHPSSHLLRSVNNLQTSSLMSKISKPKWCVSNWFCFTLCAVLIRSLGKKLSYYGIIMNFGE